MSSPLIAPDELADAAFQMLASSTVKRYLRVAREAAEGAGLTRAMSGDPDRARAAIQRARSLWKDVASASGRVPAEFELGLLLVALADARPEGAETLLTELASSAETPAPWSVSLARRLRQYGAPLGSEQQDLSREVETALAGAEASPGAEDPRLEAAA